MALYGAAGAFRWVVRGVSYQYSVGYHYLPIIPGILGNSSKPSTLVLGREFGMRRLCLPQPCLAKIPLVTAIHHPKIQQRDSQLQWDLGHTVPLLLAPFGFHLAPRRSPRPRPFVGKFGKVWHLCFGFLLSQPARALADSMQIP